MERDESEELMTSLLGRVIVGVGVEDGDLFLDLDDERTVWVWSDDEESLNLSVSGQKAN